MTEKSTDLITTKLQSVEKSEKENSEFTKGVIKLCALACNNVASDDFDIIEAKHKAQNGLKAFGATGGLQETLIAQMLSIHQLQQQAVALVNGARHPGNIQYLTNVAVKLANCFTQQVNTLSRLQGNSSQKITVEHVDVHSGGQAIVGNITGGTPTNMEKI